jgi:hydrogenase maturation protein HypF
MTLLSPNLPAPVTHQRLHLRISGLVQGVGFRPYVYGLATALGLGGWVRNTGDAVELEVEGSSENLAQFLERLVEQAPPPSHIAQVSRQPCPPQGSESFEIRPSSAQRQQGTSWVLPDLATCPDCLQELFDPQDRRYAYPLINCTHCGPRFSILRSLPYDRPQTTMRGFRMCPACQQEYHDPANRRFHAQPNACPVCGPHLELWDATGVILAVGRHPEAVLDLIEQAAEQLRQGQILALKGLGGFQLLVDARNQGAVQRLRDRKQRPSKPLAVMLPSLEAAQQLCEVSAVEAGLLTSPAAPIVLLQRRPESTTDLAAALAPNNPTLGSMLPATPLHHLLLAACNFPLVATSGNRSDEPLCFQEEQVLAHLGGIADGFLIHTRPIHHPLDDSVVRVARGQPLVLRRARGYAPQPMASQLFEAAPVILALGGHLKNSIALSLPGQVVLSQHIGDLDTPATLAHLETTVDQLLDLYRLEVQALACDAHPDYASSQLAHTLRQRWGNLPLIPVQHHTAHVLSAMVDHQIDPPLLGFAWDGTGYGSDGCLWGGEALAVTGLGQVQRVASFRPFPLPGGEAAAREPRRAALGLLYAALGEAAFSLCDCPSLQAFTPAELQVLQGMLRRQVNSPLTSSVGRLFDAIASLLGLCQRSQFEGDAAMQLEFAQAGVVTDERYPFNLQPDAQGSWVVDWQPMLEEALLAQRSQPAGLIAARFHNTLAEIVRAIAQRALATPIAEVVGLETVVLTGGCFQNRALLERTLRRLRNAGFQAYAPHQVPPNDGGLAVGQLLAAHWALHPPSGGSPCA